MPSRGAEYWARGTTAQIPQEIKNSIIMHDYTSATYKTSGKKSVRNNIKLFTISFGHNKVFIRLSLMQQNATIAALCEQDSNDS